MSLNGMFDLKGQVAVVTGGNGGIGRGIASGLARAGAAVAVLARNEKKNEKVLGELKALGVPALAVKVDVNDRAQLKPALEKVEKALGPVSILVNNAGTYAPGGVLEEAPEDWDRVFATNVDASFLLARLVAPAMVKARRGKIINIASEYALFGASFIPSYSASKGALVQLTKSMAIELAPHNVQVNAIAPGWFETDMTAGVREGPMYQQVIARTPAGRWGKPEECAGAAVFLASRASDFVTGATLFVDGGYAVH